MRSSNSHGVACWMEPWVGFIGANFDAVAVLVLVLVFVLVLVLVPQSRRDMIPLWDAPIIPLVATAAAIIPCFSTVQHMHCHLLCPRYMFIELPKSQPFHDPRPKARPSIIRAQKPALHDPRR